MQTNRMKNLFLQQSYLDSWAEYKKSLTKTNFINWDFVVLTASNEEQAQSYRIQIEQRIEKGLLAKSTHYAVLSDPDGKRVGSGGATFNVLQYIKNIEKDFKNKRILVIHSGGDSKRVPQYSVCGKLFSPVPRQLPNTNRSTLFDEFIIAMSGVPSRMKDGMLVLSGDVLLLFNPLQIDFQFGGVAAISIKETVETGKNHGVFLNDNNGVVERFLHKLSVEELTKYGAVNSLGDVDIDTGAVLLDSDTLEKLYSLIDTEDKFNQFVNETARISFYGDFLYPLSIKATLEEYYTQAPEGSFNDELKTCRTAIWNKLKDINMKLLCLSPAEFIHFGTTNELLSLMTENISDFEFLNWSKNVNSNMPNTNYAVSNSMIEPTSEISSTSYIEDSYILGTTKINENCVIANITLNNIEVPKDTVMHALKLKDGRFVVRIYGVNDNPKGSLEGKTKFLCTTLDEFSKNNVNKIWDNDEHYLWFAKLYIPADSIEKAVRNAILLYKIADKTATNEETEKYFNSNRLSLYSSFNFADAKSCIDWQNNLADNILVSKFILAIENNVDINRAQEIFGDNGITQKQISMLLEIGELADLSKKIRIQYYLGKITNDEELEIEAFKTIGKTILDDAICNYNNNYKFARDEVKICLPVRVNWGGGWSDTPPYCNENGGTVLNASLKLNGQLPVEVIIKRLKKLHIVFESEDSGAYIEIDNTMEIQDGANPFDPFALHKAALIASGIIPIYENVNLQDILKKLGGGIHLSTQVRNIPRGSGLGTSSILAGACIKGIFEAFDVNITDNELYSKVLYMEQIMSTGGGWQDQVGGLTSGIKFITTNIGIKQEINCEQVKISDNTKLCLQERFALIYTGQRRLARNLLREVVGKYISGNQTSIEVLCKIQRIANQMKFELEKGNIDEFAELLNLHWELSKALDNGSTNTCIDQIFLSIEDLICGKMVCGAGGGGFLQVILKKGITKENLQNRLKSVFQDSGVDVWDCEFF